MPHLLFSKEQYLLVKQTGFIKCVTQLIAFRHKTVPPNKAILQCQIGKLHGIFSVLCLLNREVL